MGNIDNLGFEPSIINGTEILFECPKKAELPEKYSYVDVLPQVINQGRLSICVPCSMSAYLNWKANLNTLTNNDNAIVLFDIYNSRENNGDGMTFKAAFKYLRHNGVNSALGILKIGHYGKINEIDDLKFAIVSNGPCFGALPVYGDYCDFWNKRIGTRLHGYHAISIVGYDEEGFIIRNSWGKEFCNNGYTKIKYSDFGKLLEIWTVID